MSSEKSITLDSQDEAVLLFGHRDVHLKEIRSALDVQIVARGDTIVIRGEDDAIEKAERIFKQLRHLIVRQGTLSPEDVRVAVEVVQKGEASLTPTPGPTGEVGASRFVRPRTDGQARYVHAMRENDLIFCVGPAGSGKTYLAVGMAVSQLRQGNVKKIVLVRPAVEAGERLGYLPGDLVAKINPYLRPLFDSLNDMMEPEQVKRYMENDIIEVCPLAYMRGRTLNEAVIILDEGQNTTISQMKMFLTRMGHHSKIVVTGDVTHVDLPKHTRSGMSDAVQRLKNIERLAIVYLNESDIVRNPLVQHIVKAYDDEEDKPRKRKAK